MTGEVKYVTANLGAISNETRPLFPAPSAANGGGISILEAHALEGGAGGTTTTQLILLKGTMSGGTFTANGTIAPLIGGAGTAFVANIAKPFAIAVPYVAAGEWVAVKENNVQAGAVVTQVTIGYVQGK